MPLASLLSYVIQAMKVYDQAESTLRNRSYLISLGWNIRNFNHFPWNRDASKKVQAVSSTKDCALQTPRENASLSKLQYITSHGDCHLPFLKNTFDIFSINVYFITFLSKVSLFTTSITTSTGILVFQYSMSLLRRQVKRYFDHSVH